jgi:carboxypeptidase Taq
MPNSNSPLDALLAHMRETALLESTMALLEWDEHTGLPEQASEYRAQQLMLLSGLVHQRRTDPRMREWLDDCASSHEGGEPNSPVSACIRCIRRDYERHVRLPESLVKEIAHATSMGQQVWVKAKRENDFASFAPRLHDIVRLRREEAALLTDGESPLYDALLDQYEEGAESGTVRKVFADLRESLVPLIQSAVQGSSSHPSFQDGEFDVDSQREFSRWVAEKIGFDFSRGRLDETEHPFCTTLGPHDHRILTRYHSDSFSSGLLGVLHEAGHGMYEQGFDMDWFGTPIASAASLGVHESQSRLWENLVGLSEPFWEWCLPTARKWFPQLNSLTGDRAVTDLNRVRRSLIRIEADEVTYNLHILIRFELELELIENQLEAQDLPVAWGDKYQAYLGIRPGTDTEGVLQDVHWSAGLIGYFPTYTLGNIYSAQLFEAADRDLGGVDALVRQGEFRPLLEWLRKHIHGYGRRYEPMALIERATGQPISSVPLVKHLQRKVERQIRSA